MKKIIIIIASVITLLSFCLFYACRNMKSRNDYHSFNKMAEQLLEEASCLEDNRDYLKAIECYSNIIDLYKNKDKGIYRMALLGRAMSYDGINHLEEAIHDFTELINSSENDSQRSDIFFQRSELYRKNMNYKMEFADLKNSLRYDPENTRSLLKIYHKCKDDSDYSNALNYLNRIISIYDNNTEMKLHYINERASLYDILKDRDNAENDRSYIIKNK